MVKETSKFIRKIMWKSIDGNVIKSKSGRFEIDVTFRKEYILRDTELRGRVGQYDTLDEAKNQAEFIV